MLGRTWQQLNEIAKLKDLCFRCKKNKRENGTRCAECYFRDRRDKGDSILTAMKKADKDTSGQQMLM